MSDQKHTSTLPWGIVAILLVVIAVGSWLFFEPKTSVNAPEEGVSGGQSTLPVPESGEVSTVSGTIIFNSLRPEEGDAGTVVIGAREHGTQNRFEPLTLQHPVTLTDGAKWSWADAKQGVTYDFVATLVIDGKEVTRSAVESATAPATSVGLTLTVTWKDLPESSVDDSQKTISGTVSVHGYIPSGAKEVIKVAKSSDRSEPNSDIVLDPQYETVQTFAGSVESAWKWTEALSRVDYLVLAELYDASGTLIGSSHIVEAVVPQDKLALTIQSKATAPVTKVTISGTVKINGSYENDSEIVMESRRNGEGGFSVFDTFPAESSRDWKYTDADNGVPYEIRATLKRKGSEVAMSSRASVTAPATKVQVKLDTGMDVSAPAQKPELTECKDRDNDSGYDAKLTFPSVEGARSYWLHVGKSKDSWDRYNEPVTLEKDGASYTLKIKVDGERYYYTQYAQSRCGECETKDSFSDFSDTLKFYCGNEPD